MSTHSLESRRSRWEARSGQTVRPLSGHHRSRADVDPASPEAGIQPGDLILEVNRRPVRSPAEIQAALQKSGSRPVSLLARERRFSLQCKPEVNHVRALSGRLFVTNSLPERPTLSENSLRRCGSVICGFSTIEFVVLALDMAANTALGSKWRPGRELRS